MPNWKKLVVSGSDASLNSLDVNGNVSAASLTGSINFSNLTDTPTLISSSAQITGNLSITSASGSFSGSFEGDGSGLTNINATVAETATVSDTFTSTTSKSVNHAFGTKDVIVTVYNDSDQQVIPATVTTTDADNVTVTFDSATTGRIVIAKGGHIVSGSIVNIQELASVEDTFTSVTSKTVTHTFGTKNVFVTVYNDSDDQIIPARVNTPNTGSVTVEFDSATTGRIVVGKAGHVVTGSSAAQWDSILNKPSGLISGSDQLTGSFDTRYALSGSTGVSDFDELTNSPFSQSASTVTTTKTIVPSTSTIDLGTSQSPFRDLYLSSASLYIDGQQVLSSGADTLTITTDVGQSIKLLETGADDIILQTDTGNIELKGTVEVLSGKKITDSAGNKILFGDSIGITGSIDLTGTVDGVDIATLKSDFDTIEGKTLVSGSSQVDFNSITDNPFTSGSGAITASGDLVPSVNEVYDLGSPTQRWKDIYLSGSTIYLGDTKVSRDTSGNLEVRDSQTNNLKRIRVDELELGSGANARKIQVDNNGRIKFTDTNDVDKVDEALSVPTGTVSSSLQITQGSGIVSGSSQVTSLLNGESLTLSNLTVNGTQTIVNSTQLDIGDSIISLNGTGAVLGGIHVNDGPVSGSILWHGTDNQWIAGPSGSESKILLATGDNIVSGSSQIDYNSIQNQPTIPTNNNQLTNGAGYITGISSGDVTTALGYTPWHAGNDGAGSGLDADTLDGIQAASFTLNSDDYFKPFAEIGDAANLNNFRTTGYASQNSNSQAAAGSNYPTSFAGMFEVVNDDTGNGVHATQRYARYNRNDFFARNYYDGTWTSWTRFLTTDDEGAGNGLDADTLDGVSWGNVNTNIIPSTNGTLNLGSATNRWNTLFTSDLSLSNGIGDYTIVEGEEDLFLYNNKSGKTFKFALIEVDPSQVPPKRD